MAKYQYKVVEVDAHQLAEFEGTDTVQIPMWLMDFIIAGKATDFQSDAWVVKKPDGSVAIYTNGDFEDEFQKV